MIDGVANHAGAKIAPSSVHLFPSRECASISFMSSSCVHGSQLIAGSMWLIQRSRHCFPFFVGIIFDTLDQLRGPCLATASRSNWSCSSVQGRLIHCDGTPLLHPATPPPPPALPAGIPPAHWIAQTFGCQRLLTTTLPSAAPAMVLLPYEDRTLLLPTALPTNSNACLGVDQRGVRMSSWILFQHLER